jgi:hypothetical protein
MRAPKEIARIYGAVYRDPQVLFDQLKKDLENGRRAWEQSQTPDTFDLFPAQELLICGHCDNQEEYFAQWLKAAEVAKDEKAAQVFSKHKRMIARHASRIWVVDIDHGGFSRFGLPYPPFSFDSPLSVVDVDRDECEKLGMLP